MISLTIRRWQIALVLYVLIVMVILLTKPSLMFRPDGSPKNWGSVIDENTSVFAPAFIFPTLAIVCYIIATLIEMIST